MLKIRGLSAGYGGLIIIRDVLLHVDDGECIALVGSNGAGKTTLLRTISRLIHATSGQITFDGVELNRLPPHVIVNMGVIHVPEGRLVFPDMTVMENLLVASRNFRAKSEREKNIGKAFRLFPVLKARVGQAAGTLSGGEQQMLALSRGLVASPKIMMLDEPSLGLAPLLTAEIFSAIKEMNREGLSILLVEQNLMAALQLSQRGYVLENGEMVLSGKSIDLLQNEALKKAYLGM